MQYTENLNLNKPEGSDFAKIQALNENADTLDEAVQSLIDDVGNIDSLTTEQKTNIVQAINGLNTKFTSHTAQYKEDLSDLDDRVTALKTVPAFLELPIPSGFSNGYIRYRKMPDGLAEVTVLLDKDVAFTATDGFIELGMLPVGFRPLSWIAEKLIVLETKYSTSVAGALARLYISGDGKMFIRVFSNGTYNQAIRISNVNLIFQARVD